MTRLGTWLLNLAYLALLIAASPWIAWTAWRTGKHREGFAAKLLGRVPQRTGDRPCVWLHAVSVGEVNLLATTLAELSRQRPEWEIVISTTTKAGFDLARKKYADRAVFYCPLDFSWATAAAMRRVRPTLLVLAELELWPNLIGAAKRQAVRVAIINGRLSDNSFRGYRRLRPLVARVLRQVDLIAAQNEETAERFRQLGARPAAVHATGSLKFDGAQTDRNNPRTAELRRLAGLGPDDPVILFGSTQAPEEEYALAAYRRLAPSRPGLRLILVPRHPERFDEVAALLDRSGVAWQRRSGLAPAMHSIAANGLPADEASPSEQTFNASPGSRDAMHRRGAAPILLVDTIGELGAWWGAATVGFVGGSFGSRGGQNMLEPAAYGAATCFGPNTWNFRDIVGQLLAVDGAAVVRDAEELEAFIRRALDDPSWAAALGTRARQLVLSQQGATRRTAALLCELDGHCAGRQAA
ncbi:MAG TPA: 3-deoxy-D-manno-octulosonic acid transferase [Lacipirellulaceae bacterium]|nr:3-deoxy-D-manno-octulosonic acid transferase [Lacipirellulaceae bacterium]